MYRVEISSNESDSQSEIAVTTEQQSSPLGSSIPVVLQPDTIIPNSIAVLPFENVSPDANDAYFATGLHDEILTQLSQLSNIKVISRQSVQRYTDSDMSLPEIARELKVSAIMQGSVRYANDRIRVTTHLVDAETDEIIWSETFERELEDIFTIESNIALNVANAMLIQFSPAEQSKLVEAPTNSPQAFALYMQANDILGNVGLAYANDELLEQVHGLLDAALKIDPQFARALSAKGGIYSSREQRELAISFYEQAVAIDPDIVDLDLCRISNLVRAKRYEEAENMLIGLLERRPNDLRTMDLARYVYHSQGKYQEGREYALRVLELAPSFNAAHNVGINYSRSGDYLNAIAAFERDLVYEPNSPTAFLEMGFAYAGLGSSEQAITSIQVAEQIIFFSNSVNANALSGLIYGYAIAGSEEDLQRLFSQFQEIENQADLPTRARAYLGAGNYEMTLSLMEEMTADFDINNGFSTQPLIILRDNPHNLDILNQPEFVEVRSRL